MPSILLILFSVVLLRTGLSKLCASWRALPLRLASGHVSSVLHPVQKFEFIHNISWQISPIGPGLFPDSMVPNLILVKIRRK